MLDAKDSNLKLCDFVTIESKQKQDFTGSPLELLLQITKRVEKQTGTTWAFVARQFAFSTQQFVNRVIYIDGSTTSELFDLNLKDAHDSRYDPSSLVAGSIVEFIITSGVLISASTTSNYAITNPNTWPTGVFVKLTIESGAIVAGRGGKGGDASYYTEALGFVAGTNGGDGGDGLNVQYAINIENNGIIGGGGGGGGGGAGTYAFASAGGGGGGASLGLGGLKGNVNGVDAFSAQNGNNANADNTNGGNGGASGGLITGGAGGNGGDLGQAGTNGGDDSTHHNYGLGGAAGDAIHGNSFIVWENIGTIYGAIT
jgi:hypothetical protein